MTSSISAQSSDASSTAPAEPAQTFPAIHLDAGGHSDPSSGHCVMEVVSYIAGEKFSDRPECACPAVAALARRLNDRLPDHERQRLLPYVVRIAGSKASHEIYEQRGFMAADFAVRIALPIALEAAGRPEWASEARAIPVISSRESAQSARKATLDLRRRADAAAADAVDAAAYAAAYAAADAAYAAAAAAAAAAADAAYAADAAAAADAARRRRLNDEAFALLDRMLALHEAPVPQEFLARMRELAAA
jgi:hypothetical protein